MNNLTKIKLFNKYDFVVNSLYKQDEEGQEVPITDIDGSTALLLVDGTSWELIDGEWNRIEEDLDLSIKTHFYPFIMSVCNSINNHFLIKELSHCYKNAIFIKEEENNYVSIKINDDHVIDVIENDFVMVSNKIMTALTNVFSVIDDEENRAINVDSYGFEPRITGKQENISVALLRFPQTFLDTVLAMFVYDMFERESKELRQERLGNYSVINFAPSEFQGEGSYPKHLEDKIKYWQRIFT